MDLERLDQKINERKNSNDSLLKKPKAERITISLNPVLAKYVNKLAEAENISKSRMISIMIEQYLENLINEWVFQKPY